MGACVRCGSTTSDRIIEFERGEPDEFGVTLRAVGVCGDLEACKERIVQKLQPDEPCCAWCAETPSRHCCQATIASNQDHHRARLGALPPADWPDYARRAMAAREFVLP